MDEKEVILTTVANLNQLALLKQQLSKEGYEVVTAANVTQLVADIQKDSKISLAVVDAAAFDEKALTQLEELGKSSTPFYVVSPENSSSLQKEILNHGASGLSNKGLRIRDLLKYIHTLLGKK